VVRYLSRCEICDGFNVVEGYTMESYNISGNRYEPNRIEMILVFRCQRQVLYD
jgi:hypothetical protein